MRCWQSYQAIIIFFEGQGYLSFEQCRKNTQTSTKKGQAAKFFQESSKYGTERTDCTADVFQKSEFNNNIFS